MRTKSPIREIKAIADQLGIGYVAESSDYRNETHHHCFYWYVDDNLVRIGYDNEADARVFLAGYGAGFTDTKTIIIRDGILESIDNRIDAMRESGVQEGGFINSRIDELDSLKAHIIDQYGESE